MFNFIKNEWKSIAWFALAAIVLWFVYGEWLDYKANKQPVQVPQVIVQPTILPADHTTKILTEYVAQPANDPAKVKLDVQAPDFIVAANGQQQVVKGLAGETKPLENGQLGFTVQSTAKIDVTDMVRNQVNAEMAKQAADNKKEMDALKKKQKRERLLWIVGTAGTIYLMKR